MMESVSANRSLAESLSAQVQRLFQKYLTDPAAPRLEEVRGLAQEVLLRNTELENTVANLKKIVRQLEAYRDRYVDLYELAPVGYVTLDEDGYVQEINLAGSQLFGADQDALIGHPLGGYVRPQDRSEFLRQVRGCCCEREVLDSDVGVVKQDGTPVAVHLRGVPIESLGAGGKFCKIAITDISERKATEETIRASEANYRAIFDTANDAIFVHDADTGAILDANQKAAEMYGYTTEELRHTCVQTLSDGNPPYSQKEAVEWIQRAMAGTPQRFDWKAKDRQGRVFWTGVNLKKVALNGEPRLLAIVRDITERKIAEEVLRENEERFRTVADNTYDWEYWRGLDGRLRYVSPSCARITGYSPEEFLADPALLERIVHPDDRSQLVGHLRREGPTPGPHAAEFRIVSRTGDVRWIEHVCHPVYGVDQRWLGQRASNRDVTDRKRSELELRARIADLEKQLAGQ